MLARTPVLSTREYVGIVRSTNTSGHPGVYRVTSRVLRADGSYWVKHYWQARTPQGSGPVRTRSFAIERYGEEHAWKLAVAAREAFVAELGPKPWVAGRLGEALAREGLQADGKRQRGNKRTVAEHR